MNIIAVLFLVSIRTTHLLEGAEVEVVGVFREFFHAIRSTLLFNTVEMVLYIILVFIFMLLPDVFSPRMNVLRSEKAQVSEEEERNRK